MLSCRQIYIFSEGRKNTPRLTLIPMELIFGRVPIFFDPPCIRRLSTVLDKFSLSTIAKALKIDMSIDDTTLERICHCKYIFFSQVYLLLLSEARILYLFLMKKHENF